MTDSTQTKPDCGESSLTDGLGVRPAWAPLYVTWASGHPIRARKEVRDGFQAGYEAAMEAKMRKDLVDMMVDKFLSWPLPQDFSPDGGIAFARPGNPAHWPVGTNLLTAEQAREMVKHMLSGHIVYEMAPSRFPDGMTAEDDKRFNRAWDVK